MICYLILVHILSSAIAMYGNVHCKNTFEDDLYDNLNRSDIGELKYGIYNIGIEICNVKSSLAI